MWTHCTVCSASLGSNDDVEPFPVGTAHVFDPERGRLWVICSKCRRWNLTPCEQRWEAVEALSRIWESAVTRVQGESLALSRLRSGMTIVRVGRNPSDSELATWRWGRRGPLLRRGVPLVATAGALTVGGALAAGVAPLAVVAAIGVAGHAVAVGALTRFLGPVATLDDAGSVTSVRRRELLRAGMNPRDDWLGWSIHLERALVPTKSRPPLKVPGFLTVSEQVATAERHWVEFTGGRAIVLARRAFPLLNQRASRDSTVFDALELIRESGGPSNYLKSAAAAKPRWVPFRHYPDPMKLSLGVVLFQEEERKALEGEVAQLERAWREAEAIAAIADDLLPPEGWEVFRDKHREDDTNKGAV